MAGCERDHAIVFEQADARGRVVEGSELDEPHGLAPVGGESGGVMDGAELS